MSLYVDIHKQLEHFHLDVTFQNEGACLALFGESGSGKSMTLKCIAGIETPDQGKIILHGKTLFDSQRKINLPPRKRNIGYLFQNYALFPHLNVLENVMISGRVDQEQALHLLTSFGLASLSKQKPSKLSGGQQQRVALCRMLASQPDLLLLDEPFAAIDHYLKDELHLTLLKMIQNFCKDVCLVTHDFSEANYLCKRMLFIEQGQVLADDAIFQLYQHPINQKMARLFGYRNFALFEGQQVCIPKTAFFFSHTGIIFHSYRVINEFDHIEAIFETEIGLMWTSFTFEQWTQREIYSCLNFSKEALIYFDKHE